MKWTYFNVKNFFNFSLRYSKIWRDRWWDQAKIEVNEEKEKRVHSSSILFIGSLFMCRHKSTKKQKKTTTTSTSIRAQMRSCGDQNGEWFFDDFIHKFCFLSKQNAAASAHHTDGAWNERADRQTKYITNENKRKRIKEAKNKTTKRNHLRLEQMMTRRMKNSQLRWWQTYEISRIHSQKRTTKSHTHTYIKLARKMRNKNNIKTK